jgi:signal transduction histidine kinase
MTELDLLPDAVLRLDADRRVLDANAAAAELIGLARAEVVGQQAEALLDPRGKDGKPVWADGWHPSARLRSVRLMPEQEIEIHRNGNRPVKVNVTGRYQRDGDGRLTGAVLLLRPAERRIHMAAMGIEIVSTVSHELRSPLTSVKGYTSLLLNRWDRLKEEQKRMMLEQVNHDADRVTRLITELLDISRLETGRLVLRRQMLNLAELAHTVVEKVAMSYPELEVATTFPDDFPRVYADPDKVEQVLTNLVENAAKYASPVGMKLVARVLDETGEVEVAVSDEGEGIGPAAIGHLFDKFFRAPDTKPTGSGLGLWISRGLVEAHGGRLVAESTPGQGATFRFTLPTTAFEDLHG